MVLPGVALGRFVRKLFLRGDAFAVNGVLKRRFRVRWHKLWEYQRGLAYVPWKRDWRVLDFGGGATLPVYYLADQGLPVWSFDIDHHLTGCAQEMARKRRWNLNASVQDLTSQPLDPAQKFDWAMSFCVLGHFPRATQLRAARELASHLKPGGYMTLTFDYSPDAPVADSLRTPHDVSKLVQATGLKPMDGRPFSDTYERFTLDRRHPDCRFTFGSLFLRKD